MPHWTRIVIHHSASDWGTARVIDGWHRERGWSGIGYHFVVLNGYLNAEDCAASRRYQCLTGSIEAGRPLDLDEWVEANEVGAHTLGYNRDSIGICMIHDTGHFHPAMIDSCMSLVFELMDRFRIPIENVKGHCELDGGKPLCPGFDVDIIRRHLA